MSRRSLARGRRHRQCGAALLVFMLILIVGAGYLFLGKLNGHYSPWARTPDTYAALKQAKAALIGYAVSYPDRINAAKGPGYLPCPDRDNDGLLTTEGSCSQAGGTNIGRFPWKYLGTDELRDSSGARLWYAVSNNYRFNPQLEPLNSETPGQFTLDGAGDIVAVLIAPGEALSGQNRDTGPNAAGNYLEDDNADLDTAFVSRAAGAFNDRVMTITRQELMQAVERRVLAEAGNAIENYRTSYGRYPWLSPYARPRASTPLLSGSVGAGSNATTLIDPSPARDFVADGVQGGDMIQNLSDGSRARVQGLVPPDTLTLSGLDYGGSNSFSPGDSYSIARFNGVNGTPEGQIPYHEADEAYASAFSVSWNLPVANGFDTTAASSLTDVIPAYLNKLREFLQSNAPAASIPLQIGLADGSCVWADEATLGFPLPSDPPDSIDAVNCGGRVNVAFFTSVVGQDKTDEVKDQDPGVNFIDLGISRGDLIEDVTDGSRGVIKEVKPDELKVADLNFGVNNSFTTGDTYRVRVASRALTGQITAVLPIGGGVSAYVYSLDNGGALPTPGAQGYYIVNTSADKVGKVISTSIGLSYFTVAASPDPQFNVGDSFEVRRSFVEQRRYRFDLRYTGSGAPVTDVAGAGKARTVSLSPGIPSYGTVGTGTTVTITDVDSGGNTLATAVLTVPATGIDGTIVTASIHYDFDPGRDAPEELPAWFFKNDWHHLVYVAEASGYAPDGGGSCTPGTDCLTVNNSVAPSNDKRLVLISAGERMLRPIPTPPACSTFVDQDRNAGTQTDYFEDENADGGTVFARSQRTECFNDQLRYYPP